MSRVIQDHEKKNSQDKIDELEFIQQTLINENEKLHQHLSQ